MARCESTQTLSPNGEFLDALQESGRLITFLRERFHQEVLTTRRALKHHHVVLPQVAAMNATASSSQEQSAWLETLRGVAVLGIFLVNMICFALGHTGEHKMHRLNRTSGPFTT